MTNCSKQKTSKEKGGRTARKLTIRDIQALGDRLTVWSPPIKRRNKDGTYKIMRQAEQYLIRNQCAVKQIVYYVSNEKRLQLGDPKQVSEVYSKIKPCMTRMGC